MKLKYGTQTHSFLFWCMSLFLLPIGVVGAVTAGTLALMAPIALLMGWAF
ncbi:MAG: hypothetical protein RSF77_02245 [Oscillospiraceae bacterium]